MLCMYQVFRTRLKQHLFHYVKTLGLLSSNPMYELGHFHLDCKMPIYLSNEQTNLLQIPQNYQQEFYQTRLRIAFGFELLNIFYG